LDQWIGWKIGTPETRVIFPVKVGFSVNLPLPSGYLLRSYGKSPFLMGKSTINGNFQ
jgi:hypothetical protein